MKNRIIALTIFSIFTFLFFGLAHAEPESNTFRSVPDNGQAIKVTSENDNITLLLQLDNVRQVMEKNNINLQVGLLPNSKFYFLKPIGETIASWFMWGDKKTAYLTGLSQKRLIEAYQMAKINRLDLANTSIDRYSQLLKKMAKRGAYQQTDKLKINLSLLTYYGFSQYASPSQIQAFTLTESLLTSISAQSLEVQDAQK